MDLVTLLFNNVNVVELLGFIGAIIFFAARLEGNNKASKELLSSEIRHVINIMELNHKAVCADISRLEKKQEESVSELKKEEIEVSKDSSDKILQPEKILKEKPIINKTIINDSQSPVLEEKVVDNILKEVSIVEEVPDYGIMKDEDGNFVITRAFKAKSPDKYSFRGFGVIDKVSSK